MAITLIVVLLVTVFRVLASEFEDYWPHMLAIVTMHETYNSDVLERWLDGDAFGAIDRNAARLAAKKRAGDIATG